MAISSEPGLEVGENPSATANKTPRRWPAAANQARRPQTSGDGRDLKLKALVTLRQGPPNLAAPVKAPAASPSCRWKKKTGQLDLALLHVLKFQATAHVKDKGGAHRDPHLSSLHVSIREQRTRVHLCPQHWLLCHMAVYQFEFGFVRVLPFLSNTQSPSQKTSSTAALGAASSCPGSRPSSGTQRKDVRIDMS